MMLLNTFLYYIFFASVVLVYGIGINKIAEFGISKNKSFFFYVKCIIIIFTTSIISWFITQRILIPLKLLEIMPLIIFLTFICVNYLIQATEMIVTGKKTTEFTVSYLIILLSICESTNFINSIIICTSCVLAMLILVPLCFIFKTRILENGHKINDKYYCIFFIFLALIILITSTTDIIWLNKGVLK